MSYVYISVLTHNPCTPCLLSDASASPLLQEPQHMFAGDIEQCVDIVDVPVAGRSLAFARIHALNGRIFVIRADIYLKVMSENGISANTFRHCMTKVRISGSNGL